MTEEREAALRALSLRLGHAFADLGLLDRALTHTSHAHERPSRTGHNEALEFLGDAVLGLVVAEMLHQSDATGTEGGMSKARAHLVASPSLARRAERLGIPGLLHLGRGEEKTGGRLKQTLWADAYEAVIAALYLDGGIGPAARFLRAEFAADVADRDTEGGDFKSALQEILQARGEAVPDYEVVAEEGPSHQPSFRVACRINGRVVAEGAGPSKKQAQQDAARAALDAFRSERT